MKIDNESKVLNNSYEQNSHLSTRRQNSNNNNININKNNSNSSSIKGNIDDVNLMDILNDTDILFDSNENIHYSNNKSDINITNKYTKNQNTLKRVNTKIKNTYNYIKIIQYIFY